MMTATVLTCHQGCDALFERHPDILQECCDKLRGLHKTRFQCQNDEICGMRHSP